MAIVFILVAIVFFLGDYVTGVDTWLFLLCMVILIGCAIYVAWKIEEEKYKNW